MLVQSDEESNDASSSYDTRSRDNSNKSSSYDDEESNDNKKYDEIFNSWAQVKRLLPSLPKANNQQRRIETTLGGSFVIVVILCMIAISNSAVFLGNFASTNLQWFLVSIEYVFAVMALCLHIAILMADPGIIHRSEKTCFPIPDAVKERIIQCKEEGITITMEGLGNIAAQTTRKNNTGSSGVYCIRCCVWRRYNERKAGAPPRHCSTCQRCVEKPDHHCGVFGRCIAGDGIRYAWKRGTIGQGNLFYFEAIRLVGWFGGWIAIIFAVVSLSISVIWWAGLILLGCTLIFYCCFACG